MFGALAALCIGDAARHSILHACPRVTRSPGKILSILNHKIMYVICAKAAGAWT
jgi:hypothetical protein